MYVARGNVQITSLISSIFRHSPRHVLSEKYNPKIKMLITSKKTAHDNIDLTCFDLCKVLRILVNKSAMLDSDFS